MISNCLDLISKILSRFHLGSIKYHTNRNEKKIIVHLIVLLKMDDSFVKVDMSLLHNRRLCNI